MTATLPQDEPTPTMQDLIDDVLMQIGAMQWHVATTCAEGHDLTPSNKLLAAVAALRSRCRALSPEVTLNE